MAIDEMDGIGIGDMREAVPTEQLGQPGDGCPSPVGGA